MTEESKRQKEVSEQFYKDAFCADSARVITNAQEINSLGIHTGGIIEIKSGDKRGTFYLASMEKDL